MNLKSTLFGIFSATLLMFGLWIVILFNVDPTQTDTLTYIAFLSSLFLWLAGATTLADYYWHQYINRKEIVYAILPVAVRHGLLVGTAAVTLLSLQLIRVLNTLEAILIIILITSFEFYLRSRSRHA